MEHILVLAYFSEAEATRYKALARVLATWPKPDGFTVRCLIATVVTGAEADAELERAFAAIMPTTSYRCKTQVTGYPARPTAMFWEILEHVAELDNGDGGFAVWFEADMVPTRPSWLRELHDAWIAAKSPLLMGRLQRRTYSPASGAVMSSHINGGACYAKSFARQIPASYKQGTFDHAPWPFIRRQRYATTDLFEFGTVANIEDEMRRRAVVRHGYRQDKDAFYSRWERLASGGRVERIDRPCCDQLKRHLGIEYCPLHSERTPQIELVNTLSLAVAVPYRSIRRRWRLLSKRFGSTT